MKKIMKVLFAAAALFTIASCSQDNKMNTYPASNDEAFFKTSSAAYLMGPTDPASYDLTVTRAVAAGEVTVPVEAKSDVDGVVNKFSIPTSVTFKDGEFTAKLTITFNRDNLTPGVANLFSVGVKQGQLPYSAKCNVSITRDYDTWEVIESGTFASDMFAQPWSQDLEQAVDSQDNKLPVFRFPSLFANNAEFRFIVEDDGTVIPFGELQADGTYTIYAFNHASYGAVYCDIAPEDCSIDMDAQEVSFVGFFWCSAGSFGYKSNTFTWGGL